MKTLLFLSLVCIVYAKYDDLKFRWLEFSPNNRSWVDVDTWASLTSECGKHSESSFIDVTYTPLLGSEKFNRHPEPRFPSNRTQHELTTKAIKVMSGERLADTIRTLSTRFPSRYYQESSARDAAEWLVEQYGEEIASQGASSYATVSLFEHEKWEQPSFIAAISCGDHCVDDSVVIVGSHIDSITGDRTLAPGADDDASGTAVALEVFKALLQHREHLNRRVEVHGYSAEEVGLLGSRDIVEHYVEKDVQVRSMMQLDMTGWGQGGAPAIVDDFVSKKLTDFVFTLANEVSGMKWIRTTCGYACSDHASWTSASFPSTFPFESAFNRINSAIHTDSDRLDRLSMEHAFAFAKLAVAYCIEMSNSV